MMGIIQSSTAALTGMWEAAILGRGPHGILVFCIGGPRVLPVMKIVRGFVVSVKTNSTSGVMLDNK